MALETKFLNSLFLDLRRQVVPLAARKKGKAFVDNAKWLLKLAPYPAVSEKPLSTETLKRLIGKEDPTILEIGCSDGEHTLWFLDSFEAPKLFCFEPEPRAIKRFKTVVGERPNVTLVPAAVSDSNGFIDFYQSSGTPPWSGFDHLEGKGWDYSGSIKRPKQHLVELPWIKYESTIKVPTTTIDSWVEKAGIGIIDFIWMDVQGAELSVFRGMQKTLSKVRYLYTEYSDKEMYEGQPSLREILAAMPGFKVIARYPEDALLKNCSPSI